MQLFTIINNIKTKIKKLNKYYYNYMNNKIYLMVKKKYQKNI